VLSNEEEGGGVEQEEEEVDWSTPAPRPAAGYKHQEYLGLVADAEVIGTRIQYRWRKQLGLAIGCHPRKNQGQGEGEAEVHYPLYRRWGYFCNTAQFVGARGKPTMGALAMGEST
jgi:hypothetical protein